MDLNNQLTNQNRNPFRTYLLYGVGVLISLYGCLQNVTNSANLDNVLFESEKTLMTAPNFALSNLEGTSVSLSSFKGKNVVIHIATTWCPFCNAEAPYLEDLYQTYRDQNVEVLLIDVKESADLVKTKLSDKFNLSFPVLLDTDGSVAASFAPKDILPDLARDEVMLASNLLIDSEGKIQFMSLLDSKNFDAELKDLKSKLNELL